MKKKTSNKKSEFVIVRSYIAGVHAGELMCIKRDTITLKNSIRLWQWYGASLSQVATIGPACGENKFGLPVPKTDIISPQGFEILYCTELAEQKIKEVRPWKTN